MKQEFNFFFQRPFIKRKKLHEINLLYTAEYAIAISYKNLNIEANLKLNQHKCAI